ncbi:hypothetical protein, partial [Burkholderia ambifaria]|uniref:hypothetical protein n=1 Tax=Burkholderia ambifaria TaxID=152480 RepID=UPI00158ED325
RFGFDDGGLHGALLARWRFRSKMQMIIIFIWKMEKPHDGWGGARLRAISRFDCRYQKRSFVAAARSTYRLDTDAIGVSCHRGRARVGP